jgi:hypothetical protein
MPKRKPLTYAALEKLLLRWPGVELSRSYGRPSLKVKGKFFTWVKEDERDVLMETQGDVFYITDHYRNSRYVLMRLSKADPGMVEVYLRRRWFEIAPKKLHAAFSGEPPTPARKAAKASTRKSPSKARGQSRQPRG